MVAVCKGNDRLRLLTWSHPPCRFFMQPSQYSHDHYGFTSVASPASVTFDWNSFWDFYGAFCNIHQYLVFQLRIAVTVLIVRDKT